MWTSVKLPYFNYAAFTRIVVVFLLTSGQTLEKRTYHYEIDKEKST